MRTAHMLLNLPCDYCKDGKHVMMIGTVNVCASCLQNMAAQLRKFAEESVRVKTLTPDTSPPDPPPV